MPYILAMSTTESPPLSKRERTRASLIQAAAELIAERGYERTSLEAVARRAGMTRGAIYGNFRDREDLFMAVVQSRWTLPPPPFRPGASFREQMRLLGQTVASLARARRKVAIAAASFQLYALTHEEMRLRIVEENRAIYARAVERLVEVIPPEQMPMPVETLVKVLHAVRDGLLFTHFLTPELITEEVFLAAFEALAGPEA